MTSSMDETRAARYAALKPYLKVRYLDNDESLESISASILNDVGDHYSTRQLKDLAKKWGWQKKINDPQVYYAMRKIFEKYRSRGGPPFNFVVPLSHQVSLKTREAVNKETARKKSAASQGITTNMKLSHAWALLKRKNITPDAEVDLSDDSSDESEDDLDDVQPGDCTQELNVLNANSLTEPSQQIQLSGTTTSELLPFKNAFATQLTQELAPMHMAISMTTHNAIVAEPMIVDCSDQPDNDQSVHDLQDLAKDFEALAFSERDISVRQRWEMFLGRRLGAVYGIWDRQGETKLRVEFAAYYITESLSDRDSPDEFDNPARAAAREKLIVLLDRNDSHLLSAIYYTSTFIGSYDKDMQLQRFYEDVLFCIEASKSPQCRVLRPIIRQVILKQQRQAQKQQYATVDEHLEDEFLLGIEYLISIGKRNSANFVILQLYRAWYFSTLGQHQKCLEVLLSKNGLEHAENVCFNNPVVIANAFALASKCYAQEGQHNMALSYLQQADFRMSNCWYPLLPYKHNLLHRQAAIHIELGNFSSGINILKEVLEFQLTTFGILALSTWTVARHLFEALNNCGRNEEAMEIESELNQQYTKAWIQRHSQ